jgi:hypothetical protein
MDIYSVVDDPSSAPFLIFGYILSADALTDAVKVNKAAKVRRKLGEDFGKGIAKIESITRVCKVCINKKRHSGYQEPACSPSNKLCPADAVTGSIEITL